MLRSLIRDGCVTSIMEYTFLRGEGGGTTIQTPVFPHATDWGWTRGRYEQMQPLWYTLPAAAVHWSC